MLVSASEQNTEAIINSARRVWRQAFSLNDRPLYRQINRSCHARQINGERNMQLRFAALRSAAMRGKPTRYISIPAGKVKPGQNYKSKSGTWAKASYSKVTQSIRGEGGSGELPFGISDFLRGKKPANGWLLYSSYSSCMCCVCVRSPQSLTLVSSGDSLTCRLPATRII